MLALILLAALVTTGPAWSRVLGLTLAIAVALWSLWIPGTPLTRAVVALLTFWAAARVLDLSRDSRPHGPVRRVSHVLALLDTRQLRPVAPSLDVATFLRGGAWLAVALTAVFSAEHAAPLARWALGALFIYALAEAANNTILGVLAAFGQRSPPLHRTPIAATSLREFWGERWNLPVSRWLRAHCYLPLARRRHPRLGLALTFLVSAGLHAWAIAVSLGAAMAAMMAGFFVLQGLLIALEDYLDVDRWPSLTARAWTLACILVPSPLFCEPMLRLFEPVRAHLV